MEITINMFHIAIFQYGKYTYFISISLLEYILEPTYILIRH
jgi:hypothetical protein